MTERDLFDALGKVSTNYVQAALDAECPTRAQRIQKAAGTVFRYALVCGLLICCCYGAVKLHNIEKLMQPDTSATDSTVKSCTAEDLPAAHHSLTDGQTAQLTGNAICEGDGGWYYAFDNKIMFKDTKTGYKSEQFRFNSPSSLLDIAYYEGSVYALSTFYAKQYDENGKIETDSGILSLFRIDQSERTGICKTIRFESQVECGEMICHSGKIWFSAASRKMLRLYCCDLQTGTVDVIWEYQSPETQELREAMPHSLCGSGKRIWFLMRNRDNGQNLIYYDTEHSKLVAEFLDVDTYTVSGDTVWFTRGSDIFRADVTVYHAVTETKLDHPYGKAPEAVLSDGKSVFICVTDAAEGHTALYDLTTKQQYLLPQRKNQRAESVAVLSGNRIYAICDTYVYFAEWDGKALGKWQTAYSTYELDSPEVPE